MSDDPKRIWACMQGPMVGLFVSGGPTAGWPEYIRADLLEAQAAEIERLRKVLADIAEYGDDPEHPAVLNIADKARDALENKP